MKFSIRDLLLVTLIVALALGWWVERTSLRAQLKKVQNESAKWKNDTEVYGKLLLELPPAGVDYPPSLVPAIKLKR